MSSSKATDQSRENSDLGGSAEFVRTRDGIFIKHMPIALPSARNNQVSTGLYTCAFSTKRDDIISCKDVRTGTKYESAFDVKKGIVWFESRCRPHEPDKCRFELQSAVGLLR